MAATSIRSQILNEAYDFIDGRISELLGDVLSEAALAAYSKSLKADLWPNLDERIINQLSQQLTDPTAAIEKGRKMRAEFIEKSQNAQAEFEKNGSDFSAELEKLRTFINTPLPIGWRDYPLKARRDYWAGDHSTGSVKRNRICGVEVWTELYKKNTSLYTKSDARRINKMLTACCSGWVLRSCINFGSLYGHQRGFVNMSLEGE